MSNDKTIKYNKVSGGRIQNNVDVIFAIDNAVITIGFGIRGLKFIRNVTPVNNEGNL